MYDLLLYEAYPWHGETITIDDEWKNSVKCRDDTGMTYDIQGSKHHSKCNGEIQFRNVTFDENAAIDTRISERFAQEIIQQPKTRILFKNRLFNNSWNILTPWFYLIYEVYLKATRDRKLKELKKCQNGVRQTYK